MCIRDRYQRRVRDLGDDRCTTEAMELAVYSWIVAGTCAVWATLISFHLIYKHFRNYTRPELQRPIIRIILMVPIYAVDSFLSLRFKNLALYLDLVRDCYESYVLYMFLQLLINFLEVEAGIPLDQLLETKSVMNHPTPLCCLTFKPGKTFLFYCKFGVLQFTLIKPFLTLFGLILEPFQLYDEGSFSPSKGYLYITVIGNVSVSISLYALVLFYMATKDDLRDLQPVMKFFCVKAVIFFSFWQGVAIAIISFAGLFHDVETYTTKEIQTSLQDFLICVEMFAISIAHSWAFTYTQFQVFNREYYEEMAKETDIVLSVKDALHPKYDIQSTTSVLVPAAKQTILKVKSIPERKSFLKNTDYDSD
eukprot:TRINITY_DN3797_c0_g1_i1.p1 TRINITY_DN3797_c0_g1~~TRINITY_DN3797_c0_g1_i1.p1  ORF type:complete len:364 (+),score=58.92 TRINITY_DN3797_c0_g1_i1:3-1094(+)